MQMSPDTEDRVDPHGDEWARLQTSLHTRQAIRALRSATEAIEVAASAHPGEDPDLSLALERLRSATMVLGRVDARVHAERGAPPRSASRATA